MRLATHRARGDVEPVEQLGLQHRNLVDHERTQPPNPLLDVLLPHLAEVAERRGDAAASERVKRLGSTINMHLHQFSAVPGELSHKLHISRPTQIYMPPPTR